MASVWVTGNSGVGKSTVCALLRCRGHRAVDVDFDGYCHWVDRVTGQVVEDAPDPVPAGWLDGFGWQLDPAKVTALVAGSADETVFLCGSVENEAAVLDVFDLVVCLVVDDDTLRHRLQTRTTNTFGRHPEELAAALDWNPKMEPAYRQIGATIIDGKRPPEEIADIIVTVAAPLDRANKRNN